jgi:magnesium chelatase family protein
MQRKSSRDHQSNEVFFSFGAPIHGEVEPSLQWVEVASSFQIPGLSIIGLPGPEVAEARDRIRAAIESIGEEFPRRKVVLNLSPASVRKTGTGSDLAMALAVLSSKAPQKSARKPEEQSAGPDEVSAVGVAAWGELGLDGRVKPLGQLSRALFASWKGGARFLLVSRQEVEEARARLACFAQAEEDSPLLPVVVGVSNLREAWQLVQSRKLLDFKNPQIHAPDLSGEEVGSPGGIEKVKEACRSLELLPLSPSLERVIAVAAIGAHHLLLLGPKGSGKSHALDWLVALQPESLLEARWKAALLDEWSASRKAPSLPVQLSNQRPVRRVSCQVRPSALLGGVSSAGIRLGEFSLSDGGLLIADEFPEWSRDSREALREPLERGSVSLNRVGLSAELPAKFIFAANGNLCPCGGWPALPLPRSVDESSSGFIPSPCRCAPRVKKAYLSRLSGPVLDRLDLVFLNQVQPVKRSGTAPHSFHLLKEKVWVAQQRARNQWGDLPGALSAAKLEELLANRPQWETALAQARLSSLRARHKVLRVAMSLALLDCGPTGPVEPGPAQFLEASCYRAEYYGLFESSP